VQYVRQQFLSLVGKEPDPASHFYWSDLLLRCGNDQSCSGTTRAALSDYLKNQPEPRFALTGTVTDEAGNPVSGVTLNLTGSEVLTTLTDSAGNFQFSDLPTSGVYTVLASKAHYTFDTQSLINPAHDMNVSVGAHRNRHSITGRITKADGTAAIDVKVQLLELGSVATTNSNGEYSFVDLPEGENYTIRPASEDTVFLPENATVVDLETDSRFDFASKLLPVIITLEHSQDALVLDAFNFVSQPVSVLETLGFSSDGVNRAIFFVGNLEGFNDISQLSMSADDGQQKYPLAIEFISDVPEQKFVKQVHVKLMPELKGKCAAVQLTAGGLTSKAAQLCFAND
jgi:hypothetical protein